MTRRFKSKKHLGAWLLLLCFFVLLTSPLPAAQTASPNIRTEIAAALYAASATHAIAERLADQTIQQQRREIEGLRIRLESLADANSDEDQTVERLQKQLTEAEERFVAELASRDRAYGQEIAVFRQAIEDIASTPQGLKALEKYNAGNELEAISILDQLRSARDAARQKRIDIESAAEARRIATLALDARNKGKLTTQQLITRYEEITRLDPLVHWDWVELSRLYKDVGNLAGALSAANAASNTAEDSRDLSVAKNVTGDILKAQGQLDEALRSFRDGLNISEKLAKADPTNAIWQRGLVVSYVKMSESTGDNKWVSRALSVARDMQQRGILAPRDTWMIKELKRRNAE